jgi:uncharacterized protein YxjI
MKQWISIHWVSLLIILLLVFTNINFKVHENKAKLDLIELQGNFKNYKLKDGTLVASSEVKKLEANRLKKLIKTSPTKTKLLAKNFQRVEAYSVEESIAKYDSIQVTHTDTLSKIGPFIQEGFKKGIGYSFNYKNTEKSLLLTDLTMYDTVTRIKGVKRRWFLGRETYTVDEIHSNPHIVVTGGKNFEIKPTKHWYTSNTMIFVVGFATGVYIFK